jgi:hypothetical protein
MINLKNDRTRASLVAGLSVVALASMLTVGAGCTKEEEQVVVAPPPPPPPPPPPAPTVTPIEQLMAEMNIDPRVALPEDKAPDNDVDRRAVLSFFDAFARGNDRAVQQALPEADRPQLAALVESGEWKSTTSRVQKIGVQCGSSPLGDKCALAVFEVNGGGDMFQPQMWTYNTDDEAQARFEAVASPPGIMDRLEGDWIASWFEILEEEMRLANAADEEYTIAQRDLDTDEGGEDDAGSSGGGLPAPGAMPPRTPPAPVAPPGLPGGGESPR